MIELINTIIERGYNPMSKTGEIVSVSGIYECDKCKNEITCVKGERFPPCSKCNGTSFRLVRQTR
jgi:Zn finger protein HypA/HybF involved in hydrogenase expression